LAADFGDRTITADLDSPARVEVSSDDYGHEYKNAIVGIKVSGSSSISSSADFTIPLAGNAIYPDVESKHHPGLERVSTLGALSLFNAISLLLHMPRRTNRPP